ncbi:hypothetical protein WME76_11785 [Sorangium sp. So ce119]|uniref:hypothetical protein n=1 Tax=Sorangium sp. So ce119 TaxID=3133279 RepID=UPI003F60B0AE
MSFTYLPFVAPGGQEGQPSAPAGMAPPALDQLERGHAALRRAARSLEHDVEPVIDLTAPARALERAAGAIYDAFDGRADRQGAVRAAMMEIDSAAVPIGEAAGLDAGLATVGALLRDARGWLEHAEARLAGAPPAPPLDPPPILASRDRPRLHAVRRASLVPRLKVPEPPPAELVAKPPPPIPRPTTFDELKAAVATLKQRAPAPGALPAAAEARPPAPRGDEPGARPAPPPGFAREIGAAIDDVAFLRGRTRECFEEVAMVGMQRAPLLGDPFRGALVLERRMLASIDVIAAIGAPALEHVPRLVAEAPVKDPSLAFASAMVLGCFAGRDALAAAEHALLRSERDRAFIEALGAALKLVPHELLPLALRGLLREPEPLLRAMAIDVLAYRGLATEDELVAAASDEAAPVAARALHHLGCAPSQRLPELIQRALTSAAAADPELREATWTAMALSDHPHASIMLRTAMEAPEGGDAAALLLALAGDEADARHLVARAFEAPRHGLIVAVGWAGAASSVPLLIDLLEREGDKATKLAAAYALERITGAGMWEEVAVEDDEIVVAEPPDPDVGEPRELKLAQIVSDPRDLPAAPAPELVEQPTVDAARWRAFWIERCHGWDLGARYRRGLPYTPEVALDELDTGRVTPGERRSIQRELIVRTGHFVRFDPHDFVVDQEEAIAAWRPIASRASGAPGRWTRPRRRAG